MDQFRGRAPRSLAAVRQLDAGVQIRVWSSAVGIVGRSWSLLAVLSEGHPDRLDPGSLWGSAHVVKPQFHHNEKNASLEMQKVKGDLNGKNI
jgi:hypothetical protein